MRQPTLSEPCLHCGAGVKRETAVAVVLEVLEAGRVVERRMQFCMHPSCAAKKQERLVLFTAKRYRRREAIDIRTSIMLIDPGTPWIPLE